jgi:hypothetical protein
MPDPLLALKLVPRSPVYSIGDETAFFRLLLPKAGIEDPGEFFRGSLVRGCGEGARRAGLPFAFPFAFPLLVLLLLLLLLMSAVAEAERGRSRATVPLSSVSVMKFKPCLCAAVETVG